MQTIDIIIYFIWCCIGMPLGIFVNRKLYTNIKNEQHQEKGKLVQTIMQTFSLLQCFTWPCIFIFVGVFSLCSSVFKLVQNSLAVSTINTFRFVYDLNRDYVSFNSLIIAISRYTLLVGERQAETFGIQRLKNLLISLSFGVPIFSNFVYEVSQPKERVWFSLFYSDAVDVIGRNISSLQKEDQYQSQIYLTFNRYMPPTVIEGMKILDRITFVILYSNIIEGLLYTYILFLYRRYYCLHTTYLIHLSILLFGYKRSVNNTHVIVHLPCI